jgi:predicted TIM-barrel fold metal-dependent hydrolase
MIGPSRAPQPGAPESVPDLLFEMDRLGIAEALVYHSAARWYSPAEGNAALLQEVGGNPRLHPCWVIVPHHAGEMPSPPELVKQMLDAGVRAARVFPEEHFFFLEPWCFGDTLAALAEARIPLLVDWGKRHWSEALRGWPAIQQVCEAFPELPLVVLREGIAVDRFVGALIERHPGLFLETSYYMGHRALETFVGRFGPERLLFGTSMPLYDPSEPIGMLLTSGLSEDAARSIAGGNLRRILNAVTPS